LINFFSFAMKRRLFADRIEGLPPKKDGANSMWNKSLEVERLIALRRTMRGVFASSNPLVRDIALTVRIHVNPVVAESCGDLDNFVTGICDGMMAAHPQATLSSLWQEAEYSDFHPTRAVGFHSDNAIFVISAAKICDADIPWYKQSRAGGVLAAAPVES